MVSGMYTIDDSHMKALAIARAFYYVHKIER